MKRTENKIIISVENKKLFGIELRNQKKEFVNITKIDEEDWEKARKYKWRAMWDGNNTYAITDFPRRNIFFLHQLILGKKKGYIIDHINGDTLDNRKNNLRFADRYQSAQNRNCLGIYKQRNRWRVEIQVRNNRMCLGTFIDIKDALQVRRDAEIKYFGDFAPHRRKYDWLDADYGEEKQIIK